MSENRVIQACVRLKVENQFMCVRNFDISRTECKSCEYYYIDEKYKSINCLLQDIRNWTLYRIDHHIYK